jgi:hypothetical protein
MANVIRHKRGTSDPSASDFSATAELLIRTDTGVVFTKKDDGTVVQIQGGGGTTDADYGSVATAVTTSHDYGNVF